MDDTFIRTYIDDVLKGLRTQYLIDLIQSYNRIQLSFLSQHLNISVAAVEELLMILILDDKIPNGRIDQVKQQLELDRGAKSGGTVADKRYAALEKWTREIGKLGSCVEDKHGTSSGVGGTAPAPMGMPSSWPLVAWDRYRDRVASTCVQSRFPHASSTYILTMSDRRMPDSSSASRRKSRAPAPSFLLAQSRSGPGARDKGLNPPPAWLRSARTDCIASDRPSEVYDLQFGGGPIM
ncbi:hypothetical protein L7F22_000312 [Adiantum nelumboides]|nr:hypothetical protein [Adiantum nelumboides]